MSDALNSMYTCISDIHQKAEDIFKVEDFSEYRQLIGTKESIRKAIESGECDMAFILITKWWTMVRLSMSFIHSDKSVNITSKNVNTVTEIRKQFRYLKLMITVYYDKSYEKFIDKGIDTSKINLNSCDEISSAKEQESPRHDVRRTSKGGKGARARYKARRDAQRDAERRLGQRF